MLHRHVHAAAEPSRRSERLVALPAPSGHESLDLLTDDALARREINDGVPYTLQRQHAPAGDAEGEADLAIVCDAVQPIDGAGDPRDQHGKRKDETGA